MKRNVSTGISTRKKKKGKEKGETMEGKKKGLSLTTQILIATAGGIVFGSLIHMLSPFLSLAVCALSTANDCADSQTFPSAAASQNSYPYFTISEIFLKVGLHINRKKRIV